MTKSFVESSSQTIQIDPSHRVRNYKHDLTRPSREACNTQSQDEKQDDGDFVSHGPRSESFDQDQELHRRLNPTRADDFATLQSELLQWRCREEHKITKTARNAAHKREMIKLLLRKEAHLLRKIDQLRNSVAEKWKTEQVELMMEMMSKPKQWEDCNGFIIRVDTPETCRARIMKSMYDNLIEKVDNVGKRIELLERIKALVETIDYRGLAKDVCLLVNRELQMLQQGTDSDLGHELMEGMRKRLSNQFTKLVTRLNAESCYKSEMQPVQAKVRLHKPDAIK